jgi:hypothetical protein
MSIGVLAMVVLAGCGDQLTSSNVGNQGTIEEEVDVDPPEIVHEAITDTQTFGADVPITATVTDADSGVLFVYLHYKNQDDGADDWNQSILMASGDSYSGTIDGDDEYGSGVDYYLEAQDKEGNVATAPEHGEDDPYHFRLVP